MQEPSTCHFSLRTSRTNIAAISHKH